MRVLRHWGVWCLQTEGESRPMPFSQVFHLANVSGSWVVTNGKHHDCQQIHNPLSWHLLSCMILLQTFSGWTMDSASAVLLHCDLTAADVINNALCNCSNSLYSSMAISNVFSLVFTATFFAHKRQLQIPDHKAIWLLCAKIVAGQRALF